MSSCMKLIIGSLSEPGGQGCACGTLWRVYAHSKSQIQVFELECVPAFSVGIYSFFSPCPEFSALNRSYVFTSYHS